MFDYTKNARTGSAQECTPVIFREILNDAHVADVCAEIKDAREKKLRGEMCDEDFETYKRKEKIKLPAFLFHAHFKNGKRKSDDAVPSGLCLFDIDHINDPRGTWAEIAPRATELRIVLAHITPSCEGLRIVFAMQQGASLAQTQAQMAQALGLKDYDESVKDYARCSFAVPQDYVLFINEKRLFETIDKSQLTIDNAQSNHNCQLNNLSTVNCQFPSDYDGIPYPDLMKALEEQLGGIPAHGSRNTFIFSMACYARYVCNDDAQWIMQVMPNYGESRQKVEATVNSACRRAQTRTVPKVVMRAIRQARRQMFMQGKENEEDGDVRAATVMPKRLPPLIKLLTSKVPDIYKAAVAVNVFPALGSHLKEVRFHCIDNTWHEATFMSVLMAKMSSGKSCINKPIKYIMADIEQRDSEAREREQMWKDQLKEKGANKDKPKRPDDLCIQMILPDVTQAAFCQKLEDAKGKFLYMMLPEIDLLYNLKSGRITPTDMVRVAWDCDLFGQVRVAAQSVTVRVPLRWNWNACCTIGAAKKFFHGCVANGTLSRINFSTIDAPSFGELPVYGTYDDAFTAELKPYIDRLNIATGDITCPQAEKMAQGLLLDIREKAQLSDDESMLQQAYRAVTSAFLKGCVLYVAGDGKWNRAIEAFCRWTFFYDMACKMRFFGDEMEEEMENETKYQPVHNVNLLDMLEDTFSREDAINMRRQIGKRENPASMLSTWMNRKYIEKDELTGAYHKTRKYLSGHKA